MPRDPAAMTDRRYHHGDLRRALLDAAGEMIEERGPDAFSLRDCARRIGVSNAAPAHHFGSAAGLLAALAAEGFARLAEAMRDARDAAGDTPEARLAATGVAYVERALAAPALFRLMFHSDRADQDDPALVLAGQDAYGVLVGVLDQGGITDPSAVAAAWSLVHGFAALMIEGRLVADPRFGGHGMWRARLAPALTLLVRGLWPR
jgi:AcrR family transcriptional regulator